MWHVEVYLLERRYWFRFPKSFTSFDRAYSYVRGRPGIRAVFVCGGA